MMGKMQKTREEIENAVVTKTTGNLLVLPKNHYLVKRAAMSVERMHVRRQQPVFSAEPVQICVRDICWDTMCSPI